MEYTLGKVLMVVGTSSDAGKSTIVMALCRIFNDLGYRVAPFKSQNMSLNSFVNEAGEEIARSQVLQAYASRVSPRAIHNPVLLKPKGNFQSQIVLLGKPYADYQVKDYYSHFVPKLIPHIKSALEQLLRENDIVIIEGAGCPAEINLIEYDIANLFIARLVNAPVILVGDIDRGGVFASLYGTIKILPDSYQSLIKAFLINKLRGSSELLTSGIEKLETLLKIPCLGIIPYIDKVQLPAEDSMDMKGSDHKTLTVKNFEKKNPDTSTFSPEDLIHVKVIRLPMISNFTDFEPFLEEPQIQLTYCNFPQEIDNADLVIIPGTKNTVADLLWLKKNGFISHLHQLHESGVIIMGICGGFQMLGTLIKDEAVESDHQETYAGIGLLNVTTTFQQYEKITQQVQGIVYGFPSLSPKIIKGYEIHMGMITASGPISPFLEYQDKKLNKGSLLGISDTEYSVFGCFLHGLWENDAFREMFLKYISDKRQKPLERTQLLNYNRLIEANIQYVAAMVKENLDFPTLIKLIGLTDEKEEN